MVGVAIQSMNIRPSARLPQTAYALPWMMRNFCAVWNLRPPCVVQRSTARMPLRQAMVVRGISP